MGNTIISFDYGRRAEYLTSVFLSPYAITVPIRGHDDRVESDFLCVGFEEESKYFVPNLKLIFWVQTKSQSTRKPSKIINNKKSSIDSILKNKMPYFIALVNTKNKSKLELYNTSERIALMHSNPRLHCKKLIFIPGMPSNHKMYSFDPIKKTATIYMGKPFLSFGAEEITRKISKWNLLKKTVEREFRNYTYASVAIGSFERKKLPWSRLGEEKRIFYPTNGVLTSETMLTIKSALQMLELTIIANERKSNTKSEILRAYDIIKKYLNSEQI